MFRTKQKCEDAGSALNLAVRTIDSGKHPGKLRSPSVHTYGVRFADDAAVISKNLRF